MITRFNGVSDSRLWAADDLLYLFEYRHIYKYHIQFYRITNNKALAGILFLLKTSFFMCQTPYLRYFWKSLSKFAANSYYDVRVIVQMIDNSFLENKLKNERNITRIFFKRSVTYTFFYLILMSTNCTTTLVFFFTKIIGRYFLTMEKHFTLAYNFWQEWNKTLFKKRKQTR